MGSYRNNFRDYKKNEKKHFNLYELINGRKDGKGVSKKDVITDYSLVNFCKLYVRNFNKMIGLNLLFIIGNFPILFYLFARSGNVSAKSLSATNILYSSFRGVLLNGNYTPLTAALNGVIGYRTVNYVPTTATYVLLGLTALVIFTFGFVNVGTAYIMRNMVRCEPIFFMSDFFYAIRRNRKQALLYGILDVLFCVLIGYDVIFFYYNIGTFFSNVCFYVSLLLAVVYFVMRMYLYVMMVTFDLSIFKLIKNAFIFSILGFKRNVAALIGMVVFCLFCYGVFVFYQPLGLLLPILLMIGSMAFMGVYAAYPKIKEIMIDPYHEEEPEPEDTEEPIFRDTI